MENGNIKLRDWNTNTIEDETIPPQQLKKIYLDNMKMEDIEKNFKNHKIVEEEKMEMTTITETTPTTSLTRNKLINQMTTTLIANSQDMDFLHINMLNSLTTSMTSCLTVTLTENTEEYQNMFTNATDAKTPQRPSDIEMFTITNMTSTLITITIPHIETQTILYDDDKLPNLTQMGTEQKGPSNTYVDISDDEPTFLDDKVIVSTNDNRDISDDEPTFLDDEVIVSTHDNRDIFMLHEEPSPIIKFCPLNSASWEECGPLVHIQKCGIIPYTNVRKDLIEEPTNVYKVVGDSNCYFKCISYALSGKEDYHDSV